MRGSVAGSLAVNRRPTSSASRRIDRTRCIGVSLHDRWARWWRSAVLNIAGLAYAAWSGEWRLKQMYEAAYFPIAGTVWLLAHSVSSRA